MKRYRCVLFSPFQSCVFPLEAGLNPYVAKKEVNWCTRLNNSVPLTILALWVSEKETEENWAVPAVVHKSEAVPVLYQKGENEENWAAPALVHKSEAVPVLYQGSEPNPSTWAHCHF